MRNCIKHFVFFFISVLSFKASLAQSKQPTIEQANYVHDKMYRLINESASVQLADDIVAKVKEVNKDNPVKEKLISAHLSMLRVIYNPTLNIADIKFFGSQLLQNNSATFIPLHGLIQQRMSQL